MRKEQRSGTVFAPDRRGSAVRREHQRGYQRMNIAPILVAGEWVEREGIVSLKAPFTQLEIGRISQATNADAELACSAAAAACAETRALPAWRRAEILNRSAVLIGDRSEQLARGIADEAGKPIRDARLEVTRSIQTFRVAAEEAKRIGGELLPLDWTPN